MSDIRGSELPTTPALYPQPKQAGQFEFNPDAPDFSGVPPGLFNLLLQLGELVHGAIHGDQFENQQETPEPVAEVLEQKAPPLELQNIPLPNYLNQRKPGGYQLPGLK